jgi:hypothetical protein
MPKWAYSVFLEAVYPLDTPCALGGEQLFGDLVFVIDGIDYSIPSHHWN